MRGEVVMGEEKKREALIKGWRAEEVRNGREVKGRHAARPLVLG